MTGTRCVPVLLVAVALVAMAGRVGWIPWAAAGCGAVVVIEGLCVVFGALAFLAVVVGVPTALLVAATLGVLRLFPARNRRAAP